MTQNVQAIYSDGTLKPLTPLDLREHELVRLTVSSLQEDDSPPEQELSYLPVPPRKTSQVLANYVLAGKGIPMAYDNLTMDPIDVD
jgi:predicted DNA-binding antitoxin AbrB/MazE fold protein